MNVLKNIYVLCLATLRAAIVISLLAAHDLLVILGVGKLLGYVSSNFVGAEEMFLSWRAVSQVFNVRKYQLGKEAKLGKPAPNVELYSMESDKYCRLLDLVKKNRPLVLNFGSCS